MRIRNTEKNDDHLGMEINGDYVCEARLHAHFRNKLERDIAASSHFRLLAVRQTRQHACRQTQFESGQQNVAVDVVQQGSKQTEKIHGPLATGVCC
jgi:hypothetical protein